MSSPEPIIALDYEPRVPIYRSRIFRRIALLIALIVATTIAVRCSRPYVAQLRYLYLQGQCLAISAPADWVAYEEDPQRAAVLAKVAGYQGVNPFLPPVGATPPVGFVPPVLNQLSGGGWVCMVFVHERISPAGNKRLAVLGYQVHAGSARGAREVELYGSGKTPATFRPGSRMDGTAKSDLWLMLAASDRLRLFWGQVDPTRADHFSIGYLLNDQRGTIDCWLRDDGRIDMAVRDGPAKLIAIINRNHL